MCIGVCVPRWTGKGQRKSVGRQFSFVVGSVAQTGHQDCKGRALTY